MLIHTTLQLHKSQQLQQEIQNLKQKEFQKLEVAHMLI